MITSPWFPAAIVALFSFGIWGFATKLAINHVDVKSAMFYQAIGISIIGIYALSLIAFKPALDIKGISFGIMSGLAAGIGSLFYLLAADKCKVSTVVTLTGLYPLITIFLAYVILHEGINFRQGAGIITALLAIYLLS